MENKQETPSEKKSMFVANNIPVILTQNHRNYFNYN